MPALLDQDSGHIRRNAETDVDRIAVAQFLCDPSRDDFGDIELRRLEGRQRTKDLARNGRFVRRVSRLQLIRRDDDVVDEYARHDDVMGTQRTRRSKPFDLCNHDPAVVAHGEGLIERPENAAFMLIGKISPFVGRRGANDRDLRSDGREEQPFVAGEIDAFDDRLGRRLRVHRAAFVDGVNEGVHSDLGQHARPLRRGLAMDIKQNARGNVVGRDRVFGDHLPNRGRLGRRRARTDRSRPTPGRGTRPWPDGPRP